MIETAFDFGYGQKIGIDIPGELSHSSSNTRMEKAKI